MELKRNDLPVLVHAYVPRIVKVGPIWDAEPAWQINQQAQQQGR